MQDILQLNQISSVARYANVAAEQNLSEIQNRVEDVCRDALNSVVPEINELEILVALEQVCFEEFQVVAIKPEPNQFGERTQIFFCNLA